MVRTGVETSENWATIPVQLGPLEIHRTVSSLAQESFDGSLRSTGFYDKPISGIILNLFLQLLKMRSI